MFLEGENISKIRSMCFVEYGNYIHEKKDIDRAIMFYEKALKLNPKNSYANVGIASAFVDKGLFNRAIEHCKEAIGVKPNVHCYLLLTLSYEIIGAEVLANEAFQVSVKKFFSDNLASAHEGLAYTYFKFAKYDKAEYHCKEAIKANPTNAGPHYNLAMSYLKQGKIENAKTEFQKVIELNSDKRYKKYALENIKSINRKVKNRTVL